MESTIPEQKKLEEKLSFNEEELTLNKNGVISEKQFQEIQKNLLLSKNKKLKIWLASIPIGIMCIFARTGRLSSLPWFFLGFLAYFGLDFITLQTKLNAIKKGKLQIKLLQGKVNGYYDTRIDKSRDHEFRAAMEIAGIKKSDVAYTLEIGANKIPCLSKETVEAFENGKEYIIHYLPLSNITYPDNIIIGIIISAEIKEKF